MNPDIHWTHTYLDFDSNDNYLTEDLLIFTRSFNESINIPPHIWTCFIAERWTSTNGASIPSWAIPISRICPRSKVIFLASVGHDYLYVKQKITLYVFDKVNRKMWAELCDLDITQKMADWFMRDKMKESWASILQRNIVYYGLRIGWHNTYNTYSKNK